MIGAETLHDDYASKADDRARARDDATRAWMEVASETDRYREVAGRLADHLRAINRAGDTAARGAVIRRDRVDVAPGAWQRYRKATIDAEMDLTRIERALGEGLESQAERTTTDDDASCRAG